MCKWQRGMIFAKNVPNLESIYLNNQTLYQSMISWYIYKLLYFSLEKSSLNLGKFFILLKGTQRHKNARYLSRKTNKYTNNKNNYSKNK